MSQGNLFEFEPVAAPTDRLFFAIAPDAGASAAIRALTAQLQQQHHLSGRPIAESKLHCTLCPLGDHSGLPAGLIARASQAAAQVAAASRPFTARFEQAQTFINRSRQRPLVVTGEDGVIGIRTLYQQLSSALLKAGCGKHPLSHTPHITLLYDDTTVAPQSIAPIEWQVQELLLLHSHIGQGRPYTILSRWPL